MSNQDPELSAFAEIAEKLWGPGGRFFRSRTSDVRVDWLEDGLRSFETGAVRDSESGKLDYEGFLSPRALVRYAEYMHEHRVLPDGSLRDSDNWQRGFPTEVYMKSLHRHFMHVWLLHRGDGTPEELQDALCAVLFNAFGYLHEVIHS